MRLISILLACLFSHLVIAEQQQDQSQQHQQRSSINKLIVISRISDSNQDGFARFNRSLEAFQLKLDLVRTDSQLIESYQNGLSSKGKDATTTTEKRRNFESLHKALSIYKNEQDLVLMLIDSSSAIVNGDGQAILARFEEFHKSNGTRILFSGDSHCLPDATLADRYLPAPGDNEIVSKRHEQRYLNSRALIGFASTLWDFLDLSKSFKADPSDAQLLVDKVDYDFQLYATNVYLSPNERHRLHLEVDHRSGLFENLNSYQSMVGASVESTTSAMPSVELEFGDGAADAGGDSKAGDEVNLKNLIHNTRPLVVHGSGSLNARIELNSLANYLGKAWTPKVGCRWCNQSMISLASIKDSDLPTVLMAVFIEEPTPFMENFFANLRELNYPKARIHLLVHNSVEYHARHVGDFLALDGSKYASQELLDLKLPARAAEWQARDYAMRKCQEVSCDYLLSLDSLARLEEPNSLKYLIEANQTVVAPLLSRPQKLWSNFWGAITRDGYYSRSHDYVDLVARERVGLWNVPLVMNSLLIEGKFLRREMSNSNVKLTYYDEKFPTVKPELIFARNLRQANVFQFMTNQHEFGHLIDPSQYNTSLMYPDFYELTRNKADWEREYLHENYTDLFDERDEEERTYPNRIRLEQPCQDVYWFPLVSDKFCNQLIDLMEQFGRWSSGTNSDPRIEGGYESVPTRDIHFKQVGLHDLWLYFLREYVTPIQLKEYIGYEHDPPRTDLAFVVRYHPQEQPSLRPHHDSSTYTLNIALNRPGVDYEGGGCRFVRYNCSVTESRKGWALIHPGRLTHYHEGLPVTKGTRYILVTFVDP